jgi:hypothetical protein
MHGLRIDLVVLIYDSCLSYTSKDNDPGVYFWFATVWSRV